MQKHILRFSIFSLLLLTYNFAHSQSLRKVILDADTGNEVDDPYAIVRALIEPSWEITSLNAAQWQASQWTTPESMEDSYRLNQEIVSLLKLGIKTRRGGIKRMYDWGDMAQHSAAAYEIIKQAKAMPKDEKLTVIALGALTNVASAIFIDPTISSSIELYWLGTTYDFEKKIFKKNDFNCMMDPQALEIMLMSSVDMHIIPVNVAQHMKFQYLETKEKLEGKHPMADFLVDRWRYHIDGGRYERNIWDLALIQAILFPKSVKEVKIRTSRDNGDRDIWFYQEFDAKMFKEEFFKTTLSYLGNMK